MTANTGPEYEENEEEQCPKRLPALSHMRSPVLPGQCKFCGMRLLFTRNEMGLPPAAMVSDTHIPSVDERLRNLGLLPPLPGAADTQAEPHLAKGLGPAGVQPRWKRTKLPYGRTETGELNGEDKRRLRYFVHVIRARTWEDRPDTREWTDEP